MRLDASQRDAIREEVFEAFGPDATVRVFGSRVRDTVRGGDIDVLVETPGPVERPAWSASRLEARLMRRFAGRRVDVLLSAPNLVEQPIHRIARAEGVVL